METWRSAWERANLEFYSREKPADHFRTSTSYPDIIGPAFLVLLDAHTTSEALQIVDVGGGDGHLLSAMRAAWIESGRDPALLTCTLVDVRAAETPDVVTVVGDARTCLNEIFPHGIRGLLIAHEWLDDIPCEVVEVDDRGARRLVLVDAKSGKESLGPALDDPAATRDFGFDERGIDWLDTWWPIAHPGSRAEVGITRDDAWRTCIGLVTEGVALMVDYAHTRETRDSQGSLAGYVSGRRVAPIPDGGCNVTAHVAVDALADVSPRARRRMRSQREALEHVRLPDDPLVRLRAKGRLATLRAANGLGNFTWLEHHAGSPPRHATMTS
ncbi:unannotated protein [freshwater metagenome]|uniref:Unannotated protein n=1 Tax=freshwater metagenome TaxID=449393 RepID=A0A6J7GXD3_9ZZZZ|nr:hypothetical protein [Actinomycetota bacterium]